MREQRRGAERRARRVFHERGQQAHTASPVHMLPQPRQQRREAAAGQILVERWRDNRMVSSLTAEIDAKSDFEVFTDPVLLDRHFSPDERDVLTRHVLWTRLVRERRTTLWDGRDVELLPFARDHQSELVLKPNRSYGGFGVVVGRAVDAAAWARALDEALRVPDAFVLQRRAEVPVHDFPAVDDAGETHLEPYYDVMGFAPSRYGLAVLGRGSQRQVVNVAQRGGMVPLVLAQHG